MIKNKKGVELSFAVIFSVIVGAVIIFLAVYFGSRLINVSQQLHSSEVSQELSVLLDPLETGIASTESMRVKLPQEVRIDFSCYEAGSFGRQEIQTQVKGVGDKWGEKGAEIPVYNKYIFSEDLETDKLYLFSKSFEFPYKVSEIIFISSDNYCLIDPPSRIEEEFISISHQGGLKNINITFNADECKENAKKVCFNEKCEISVFGTCTGLNCRDEFDTGYVEKDNEKLYFSGNLLFGALFSSPDNYECNVKRLMKRVNQLGLLYISKSDIVAKENCIWGLDSELSSFMNSARNLNNSVSLLNLKIQSDSLKTKNENTLCEMW